MEEEFLSEATIYELALSSKQHQEDKRDGINSYYSALFAAIIAVIPFVQQATENVDNSYEGYVLRLSLSGISIIGLFLTFIWIQNLKRTLILLQSLDKIIFDLEEKNQKFFMKRISDELTKQNAPSRITKYQITIPYIFMAIFSSTIFYSLMWIFAQIA